MRATTSPSGATPGGSACKQQEKYRAVVRIALSGAGCERSEIRGRPLLLISLHARSIEKNNNLQWLKLYASEQQQEKRKSGFQKQ
jgi:hypothetical protein